MDIATAVSQAKEIQKQYPEFYLCGSLALSLFGLLDKSYVNDLDFVTESGAIPKDAKENAFSFSEEKLIKIPEYTHFKINIPTPFCLFKSNSIEVIKHTYSGIICQNPLHVLWWKKQFNREKDRQSVKAAEAIIGKDIQQAIEG